eukprot:CAMPEP_0176369894 /NCGR_PEP_ID=MMETSP0126-20121128/23605_1 /TAXON_ID=141414 ORGANISM="Strombidinopsis acuminatum, Strain SPMC142" /NCGR_SAMPLE_ID=MMETSP0126 /ASSEMBLY_ACC=CAM_ASM_000229 /LENGTH=66 /DNA_ID=CAMNT_0017728709 /DNA_START=354 /DNA_END=554 /DNA_ORIENTATION=+
MALLLLSKIKVTAVLVGLSVLLPLLNVPTQESLATLLRCQSNNLLIVIPQVMAAMAAGTLMPMIIF